MSFFFFLTVVHGCQYIFYSNYYRITNEFSLCILCILYCIFQFDTFLVLDHLLPS